MADLKNVIRLRRFQLDERRLALVELQRLSDHLATERARLDASIAHEKQTVLAADDPGAGFAFAGFIKAALERGKRLDESLRNVETQIAQATEQLREAFADLKKFEQTEAQRQARALAKRIRAEGIQLDEIGVELYRRRAAGQI